MLGLPPDESSLVDHIVQDLTSLQQSLPGRQPGQLAVAGPLYHQVTDQEIQARPDFVDLAHLGEPGRRDVRPPPRWDVSRSNSSNASRTGVREVLNRWASSAELTSWPGGSRPSRRLTASSWNMLNGSEELPCTPRSAVNSSCSRGVATFGPVCRAPDSRGCLSRPLRAIACAPRRPAPHRTRRQRGSRRGVRTGGRRRSQHGC